MVTRDRRGERRAFWFALGVGLFVFLTLAGLLTVDYRGRRLSFGDSTPPVSLDRQCDPPRLHVKALGIDGDFDGTRLRDAVDFLCDFGCLPHP